eukprot:33632_1
MSTVQSKDETVAWTQVESNEAPQKGEDETVTLIESDEESQTDIDDSNTMQSMQIALPALEPMNKVHATNELISSDRPVTHHLQENQDKKRMPPPKRPKKHECPYCSYATRRKIHLTNHVRTHTGEKPFKCLVCGKAFTAKKGLKSHERTHLPAKQFQCEYCGKGLSSRNSLKVHTRSHTGEKPFKCGQCGKGYSSKSGLIGHMNGGAKACSKIIANKCLYCDEILTNELKRQLHVQTHHPNRFQTRTKAWFE